MPWNTIIPNLIIFESTPGQFSGIFGYSPAPAFGNLIFSLSVSGGTDPFGNTFIGGGLVIYGTGGSYIFLGELGGLAELQMHTGDSIEGAAANLFTSAVGSGVTRFLQTGFSGPKANVAGHTDWLQLQINSSNANGTSSATAFFNYIDDAQIVHAITAWSNKLFEILAPAYIGNQGSDVAALAAGSVLYSLNGQLKYASGNDSNKYMVGRLTLVVQATQQFTLASAVNINGLTGTQLFPGTYFVRMKLWYLPTGVIGSTHVTGFAFNGAATCKLNAVNWQTQAAAAITQSTASNVTAIGPVITSPTHVAFNTWLEIEGEIIVTSAGILNPQITLTTAGDDITIAQGSFLEILPMS